MESLQVGDSSIKERLRRRHSSGEQILWNTPKGQLPSFNSVDNKGHEAMQIYEAKTHIFETPDGSQQQQEETVNPERPHQKDQKQHLDKQDDSPIKGKQSISDNVVRCEDLLSPQEKAFRYKRKSLMLNQIQNLMGDDHTYTNDEIPNIAVIGSGGGMRALLSMSGVFNALYDTGLLQYILYTAALSGSSWYLAALYSHKDWPNVDPRKIQEEIKKVLENDPFDTFSSTLKVSTSWLYSSLRDVRKKSLAEIFGHFLASVLIPDRYQSRWSDAQKKINDGQAPLPLLSCIHVEEDIPAKEYHEWVEFSPYETSLPKYGIAMKMENFGSEFTRGKLDCQKEEVPLYFLKGICGSAFTALSNEIPGRKHKKNESLPSSRSKPLQIRSSNAKGRIEVEGQVGISDKIEGQNRRFDKVVGPGMGYDEVDGPVRGYDEINCPIRRCDEMDCPVRGYDEIDCLVRGNDEIDGPSGGYDEIDGPVRGCDEIDGPVRGCDEIDGPVRGCDEIDGPSRGYDEIDCPVRGCDEIDGPVRECDEIDGPVRGCDEVDGPIRGYDEIDKPYSCNGNSSHDEVDALISEDNIDDKDVEDNDDICSSEWLEEMLRRLDNNKSEDKGFTANNHSDEGLDEVDGFISDGVSYMKERLKEFCSDMQMMKTRAGRAAQLCNPLRKMSFRTYNQEFFDPPKDETFSRIFDKASTTDNFMYFIDAGLAFNLPFPLVLRSRRNIDVILSFDFTDRGEDNNDTLKQLRLAEKWAKLHGIKFPPIPEDFSLGIREIYIFEDDKDDQCPVVVHMPLVNRDFRLYSKPGVKRSDKGSVKDATFHIFSDPRKPYTSAKFNYSKEEVNRLCDLMEFNVKNNVETITECIKRSVEKKRDRKAREINGSPGDKKQSPQV